MASSKTCSRSESWTATGRRDPPHQLALEGAEDPVPEDEDPAVVLVEVLRVDGVVDAVVERKLGDLRVGKEGEIVLDLMRKERAVEETIGDVVRSEDDLVGVGIPKPSHAAFCGRLREGFEVPE